MIAFVFQRGGNGEAVALRKKADHLTAAGGDAGGIHEAEPGIWWGSRLAVATDYRRISALGTSLIRLAVSSAHARGCRRFYAHVQAQNALLFRQLGWNTVEEIVLHGRPHHFMHADLGRYPPIADAETGFLSLPKKAA